MSYDNDWFDQPNRPLDDFEYPDEDSDDSSVDTIVCPTCGKDIYEEAVQCPYCGNYVTTNASVWSGRPVWWIVLGVLGAVATILVLAGWF